MGLPWTSGGNTMCSLTAGVIRTQKYHQKTIEALSFLRLTHREP